jgi:hypothetical protein
MIQQDDLIYNKIRCMNKSKARRNLFTLLKFDIKGFINPYSIKHSALTCVDIKMNDVVSSLTTKAEIEDHLLQRNAIPYWASGATLSVIPTLEDYLDTQVTPLRQIKFFTDHSHIITTSHYTLLLPRYDDAHCSRISLQQRFLNRL